MEETQLADVKAQLASLSEQVDKLSMALKLVIDSQREIIEAGQIMTNELGKLQDEVYGSTT